MKYAVIIELLIIVVLILWTMYDELMHTHHEIEETHQQDNPTWNLLVATILRLAPTSVILALLLWLYQVYFN